MHALALLKRLDIIFFYFVVEVSDCGVKEYCRLLSVAVCLMKCQDDSGLFCICNDLLKCPQSTLLCRQECLTYLLTFKQGRCSVSMTFSLGRMLIMALPMTFSSSRTFPGHE